ncbi:MAG: hypothetical protein PF542_01935 [Nanoarchaeota archaeon]|jgi:hypothetical protein|nr:hypothetical protein [Nanoarchaeota archaeon]
MSFIKSGLDEIEINNSKSTLIIIASLLFISYIIGLKFLEWKIFMQAIYSSLFGVFIAILFINYNSSRQKKKFKKKYLIKFSPILKRLFTYIYIDLEHLVNFSERGIRANNYEDIFEKIDKLVLNDEYLDYYKKKIDSNKLFIGYKTKLVDLTSLNVNHLSHNLILNISEIIERLNSLALYIELKDDERTLKNIKAIFKHLKIIDKEIFKLNLDGDKQHGWQ